MADLSSLFAQAARRPTMAELLMKQSISTAPAQGGWGEGLARALMGGMAGYFEKQDSDAEGQKFDQMFGLKPGAPVPSPTPAAPDPKAVGAALQAPVNKIYSQDERNPLDLPAGPDRDLMIRTIHAEAGNQDPEGMRAVASVIRNRAANGGFGGDTIPGVIRAPNQFEPVNTPAGQQRMAALPAGSQQYSTISKAVDEAYAGNDPTNGATNFYAPKAQAALGRNTPAWAKGPGQDIGDHRFYGSPQDPAVLPPNATLAQGGPVLPQAQPGQRQAPQIPPDVLTRARSLWTSGDAQNKAAAMAIIQPYLAPKDQVRPMTDQERVQWKVPDGVSAGMETTTGKPVFSQPANNVNVNTVANPVLEGVGKQIVGQRDKAQAATNLIPMLHEARTALDQGAITGSAADLRLSMAKVGNLFGLTNEQVSNTEVFKTAIGNQVLGHIKELGANPSNADRDYIEKVQGGQIALDEKSLRRIIEINEKYSRRAIENFNRDSKKLMDADPRAYSSIAPLMQFDQPAEYKPPRAGAASPVDGGWTTLPNGVRIREKK